MKVQSESLQELRKNLQTFPGIGEKTAQRLAYFLINQPPEKSLHLARSIINAVESCKPCQHCFMLADSSPCPICTDLTRDATTLCIVESTKDIDLLESTNEFNGRYFVLGRLLSPIDGIGPAEIRINELHAYLNLHKFSEVILAISPSTEGETTIAFIAEHINKHNLKITRLSTGIPYGGDMEYTGASTLLNALRRRFPV